MVPKVPPAGAPPHNASGKAAWTGPIESTRWVQGGNLKAPKGVEVFMQVGESITGRNNTEKAAGQVWGSNLPGKTQEKDVRGAVKR